MIAQLVACALACTGCVSDAGPRLEAATPDAAPRRARVTLVGARLCGADGDCERAGGAVRLGDGGALVQATIVAYADDAAEIVIPELAPLGPTTLVVTVNELASNALAFEVLP